VKFNIVQPTARGEKMHQAGETLGIRELIDLGQWIENDLARSTKIGLFGSHPVAFRSLGKMFGENHGGCGVCGIKGILGVLSDGSYALCGIGEHVPELVFGHAACDSLGDVWRSSPILRETREGLPHRLEGICGECLMKSICLGGCIAQNYYRSRGLWAPNWFCQESDKMGLFPQTRRRAAAAKRQGGRGEPMVSASAR
jgi:SynChlorMet cassette radical SAM/SPASM protein ScmF